MRIIGYTGARDIAGFEGMVNPLLAELDDVEGFVTGGCTGLDTHVGPILARRYPHARHTVITPGNSRLVAFWWLRPEFADVEVIPMRSGTSYRARNAALVRRCTELYAFPRYAEHDPRSLRSGTWMTVRIARKRDIPVSVRILAGVPAA